MGQLPSAKDTVASDTTTSTTYEDVDGLTVQLTVDDTSDILLLACVQASGSASAKAGWRLVFDSVNFLDLERQVGSEPGNIMLADLVSSKGAGTYTFKLQHKVASGTLTTANATIIAVSLHNGSGVVPANSAYVASDTVGNSWEDIPGLSCSVTLSATSHIWAVMVWNGYHSGANKNGFCLINIDGTDMEMHERDWGTANQYGCVSVVTRTDTAKVPGVYTVKGRWKGAGGTTLTGEDFKLVVIAAEANSGADSIDITKDVVASDTTVATALEDIDGLSVSAAPGETAHILGVMCMDTDVGVNNTSAYTAIDINGTNSLVMERGHAVQQRHGSIGQIERTASTLGAGSYTVKGEWYTDSGNTLTGAGIVLTSIVLAATSAGATPKLVTDAGSGNDAISLLGKIPVADNGAGADLVSALGKILVADAGSGADIIALLAEIFAADNGSGVDVVSLINSFIVLDSGSGVDVASVKAYVVVTDAGAGVDSVSVQIKVPILVTDVGAGADVIASIKAMLSVLDSGAGTDQVAIKALVNITDTGSGVETLTINVVLSILDSGAAVDAVSMLARILAADSGVGADTIASIINKFTLPDSGIGADAINILGHLIVVDGGVGADIVSILAKIPVTDSGSGVDIVSAIEISLEILRLITKTFSQFNIVPHYSSTLDLRTKEHSNFRITSTIKGGG